MKKLLYVKQFNIKRPHSINNFFIGCIRKWLKSDATEEEENLINFNESEHDIVCETE